ncbi:MAG: hypothetical protein LBJ44_05930 [Propionibacteriaceae bacterium]|jgi:hypothetical protein|nr:hypothetical protein [Propionibacteriaceae bacterium]
MLARLPGPVRADLRRLSPRARVLAWAETESGHAVALAGQLAWSRGAADWGLIGWHDVVRGSWDSATSQLAWQDGQGREERIELTRPGRLPIVFQDRVEATFVLERRLGQGRQAVVVSAQRRLDDDQAALIWRLTPIDRTAVRPDDLEEAERLLERLRASYD